MSLFGFGLRPHYFLELEKDVSLSPQVLEILSDNLIGHRGGPALFYSDLFAQHSQILLHCVGMNIGGISPLDMHYLSEIKLLKNRYQPLYISDHLCFSNSQNHYSYELLPILRNAQELKRIINRICIIQEFLNTPICIENISSYVEYESDEISEGQFFSEMVKQTDCGILFDVNNHIVNSTNFSRNALNELKQFPLAAIKQIHVGGHTRIDDFLFDTHDRPICKETLHLLKNLIEIIDYKSIPIILEHDDSNVELKAVLDELEVVKSYV